MDYGQSRRGQQRESRQSSIVAVRRGSRGHRAREGVERRNKTSAEPCPTLLSRVSYFGI